MGLIIGILFLVSGIPQIVKIHRTKNVQGISLSMYLITWLAMALTIVQAIMDGSMELIISTSVSLITVSYSIFLVLFYG